MKKVSQDVVNKIYPLLSMTVKMLNKHKIAHWATGGTLLGTVRSKGMVQWDDDIDIAIQESDVSVLDKLKEEFKNIGLRLYKASGKYFKVKYAHRKDDHLWIDIFIVDSKGYYLQGHKIKRRYLSGELFPLKKGKFGPVTLSIPNKSIKYLNRIFPNWRTIAHIYNHDDKKKHKVTKKLTAKMKKPLLPTKKSMRKYTVPV